VPVLEILVGKDNPALRTKATPVPKVTKEIQQLLKDMELTTKGADGLGLAAPQVGVSLRVCISNFNGKLNPMINPEITWKSEEEDTIEEGCLSLPDITVSMTRSSEVIVQYLDAKGNEQERKLEMMDARAIQHEIDHLDGVMIVDYAHGENSPPAALDAAQAL